MPLMSSGLRLYRDCKRLQASTDLRQVAFNLESFMRHVPISSSYPVDTLRDSKTAQKTEAAAVRYRRLCTFPWL